ncbi:MAG: hypothetical protein H0T79_14440, partial [Deltaproteobacteria bacterium]|nr:hypothetical protein [Deltaproteobacteria bacterium]
MRLHPRIPSVLCTLLVGACAGGHKVAMAPASSSGYVATDYSGGEPAPATQADYGPSRQGPEPAPDRPGLGTSWGESVEAPVSFAPFTRASMAPWAEVGLHYNDAQGVQAHASYLGAHLAPLEVYAGDGALGVALVDESGHTLPGFQTSGRTLVMGEDGARYRIVVRNGTTARFEVVASVDGLDVIDGKPADPNRRGYIVDPHGVLVIDGFRTSDQNVAAFRFGKVSESYAAQSSGDRNVGVVGLAIFSERGAVWT